MDNFFSWVNDPNTRACAEGKRLAKEYRDKSPQVYWETLHNPEHYLFGIVSRSPATALRLITRCIEELLAKDSLPDQLAEARRVALDQNATEQEMERCLHGIGASRGNLKRYKQWRHYYGAVSNLLRLRLGLTKPMISIAILKSIFQVMVRFKYPIDPFKDTIAFMKKELPYEEWIGTYEEWNEQKKSTKMDQPARRSSR